MRENLYCAESLREKFLALKNMFYESKNEFFTAKKMVFKFNK